MSPLPSPARTPPAPAEQMTPDQIEIVIWTHIAYLPAWVDSHTLAQMRADADAEVVGRYGITSLTGEKRTITVNWDNVGVLEEYRELDK